MKTSTRLVHFEACPRDPFGPTSTPIYQTATFAQGSASACGEFDYTRSGNPTRAVLEGQLAALEGGARALAFTSGMAALAAVGRLVASGEEVVAGNDLYGGTFRLLTRVLSRQGITVRFADPEDLDALDEAIGPRTRLVLVETPTNPLQRICDLSAVAERAHAAGAWLAVDNSLMSPYLQRPLEQGADLVVHSATKYLSGHSDLTGGVVVCADAGLAEEVAFFQNAEGAGLAPFDCWLLLRGAKTLGLRLDRQQANAQRVAEFLAAHPAVQRVHFPGLPDHPGRDLHFRQASGPGALVSFETGSETASLRLVEALRLFAISVSFGNVASLASLPCRMSHASIPAEVRARRALPEDLVRLSIGIEDADDLLADLEQALALIAGRPASRAVERVERPAVLC